MTSPSGSVPEGDFLYWGGATESQGASAESQGASAELQGASAEICRASAFLYKKRSRFTSAP
jgi:hypothetical protein